MTEATTTPAPEATQTQPPAGQQVAVQRVREVRVTTDALPVWDTADFEHMGRVATVMAKAALLPMTLTHVKDGDGPNAKMVELPFEVVQARALLVCNQARLWNMDPLAVAQATSLVHNRLMYEGKLVHAVVEARLGIRLRYEFGLWHTDHFEPVANPSELNGAGERLAVRVIGQFDDEEIARTVEGSVGLWSTGDKGPWQKAGNYPRQLRYRGAREWARAHAPGVILGVYSPDDNFDDAFDPSEAPEGVPDVRPGARRRNLKDKLQPPAADAPATTDPAVVAQQAQEAGAPAAAADAPADTGTAAQDAPQAQDGDDQTQGGADEATDAEFTDIGEGGDDATGATQDDGEEAPDFHAQAVTFSQISPLDEEIDVIELRLAAAHDQGDVITQGHAEVGEVYLIAGDAVNGEGKRLTYKDGTRFSQKKDVSALKVYAIHAPLPVEPEGDEQPQGDHGGHPDPTEEQPQVGHDMEEDDEAEAGAEEADEGPTFMSTLRPMTTWAQIKAAVVDMNKTPEWAELPVEDQDAVRAMIWAEVERVKADHGEKIDFIEDATAFMLWMATQRGVEGADATKGNFEAFKRQPIWGRLKPEQQQTMSTKVEAAQIRMKRQG